MVLPTLKYNNFGGNLNHQKHTGLGLPPNYVKFQSVKKLKNTALMHW